MNKEIKDNKEEEKEADGKFVTWLKDVGHVVVRSFFSVYNDNVTILASGLVYSSLIAIIPAVTFLFAFLSSFGVINTFLVILARFLNEVFSSSVGEEMIQLISQYTSNAMGLGIAGLISFVFTAILLVNKIYVVINQIFRTQPRKSPIRRFITFLTFLIIGVFVVALSLSLANTASNYLQAFEGAVQRTAFAKFLNHLLPIGVLWVVLFSILYFVPNAKIRISAASIGATLGTVALIVATSIFTNIIISTVSYSVIYGSLASILFLLLYLYIAWYIIIVTMEVVYVYQFRPDLAQVTGQSDSPARQITEAVNVLMIIGDQYRQGKGATNLNHLTRTLALKPNTLTSYLSHFEKRGFILIANTQGTAFIPAKPLDQIYIKDVIEEVFGLVDVTHEEIDTIGEAIAEQIEKAGISSVGDLTLENMLERI